jgi:hypothetical protein
MKANVPRSWHNLPPIERRAIENLVREEAYKLADRENEGVQEVMIKLFCIWLHDHGETEEEVHAFIAWMRRTYRQLARCKTEAEQAARIGKEIERCFPDGFPQMRIDDMKSKEGSILDE